MLKTQDNKSKGGSFRLGFKAPFQEKRKLTNIMLAPQGQRKRVPGLGFAEPEGAPVLSCPNKWQAEQISMVRVI